MSYRRTIAASALVLLAAAGVTSTSGQQAQAAAPLCGTAATAPATYDHVIWIVDEDKNYASVVGSKYAPYINTTLIPRCGLATNFHPETHNSLGDYVAMVSGTQSKPTPPTIFGQLRSRGKTWRAYMQTMPANCYRTTTGNYSTVHNPPEWFNDTAAACPAWDVPETQLATDLSHNTLPTFAFIAADNAHNMHNNPVASGISTGDAWLNSEVTKIVSSPTWLAGRTAIFITWDEGNGPKSTTVNYQGENCLDPTKAATDLSCHVATIVIAPHTRPGTRSSTFYSHYNLLATTEDMLGLTRLGSAASAASMRAAFGL